MWQETWSKYRKSCHRHHLLILGWWWWFFVRSFLLLCRPVFVFSSDDNILLCCGQSCASLLACWIFFPIFLRRHIIIVHRLDVGIASLTSDPSDAAFLNGFWASPNVGISTNYHARLNISPGMHNNIMLNHLHIGNASTLGRAHPQGVFWEVPERLGISSHWGWSPPLAHNNNIIQHRRQQLP